MRKGKKKIILLLILVIGISIGYAALANMIKINGTSVVKGSNWNIYWDNVNVESGSVTGANVITTPTTVGTTTTEVEFSVVLPEPGDYYEFTIDAVNAGTIDAMIEDNGVQNKVYSDSACTQEATLPDVVKYTVTNLDGSTIESGHVLPKKEGSTPTREKYKVRVEYRNDEEINPSDLDKDNDKTYYFKFAVTYVQADNTTSDNSNNNNIICIKATTLHQTTCQYESGTNGCLNSATGYSSGSPITYGHTDSTKLVNGELTSGTSTGYALDCDLTGTGTNYNERFYYVSDLMYYDTTNSTVAYDSDYAVLIYYSNVANKVATPSSTLAYYTSDENWHGASSTFMSNMPLSTDWINTLKRDGSGNSFRQLVNNADATSGNGNTYANYDYTAYGGRLLTYQEVVTGCGGETNLHTKCEFLMENTRYEVDSGPYGYWLDTPRSSYSSRVYSVNGRGRALGSSSASSSARYGLRPAIEVLKSNISLE